MSSSLLPADSSNSWLGPDHPVGLNVTPHVAQNNTVKASAIDGRTTRHEGYEVSQRKRKLVEEIFGWMKTVGLFRKTRHRGTVRVD